MKAIISPGLDRFLQGLIPATPNESLDVTQLKVKGILLTETQSTSIVFIYSRQCTCTAGGRTCLKYIVRLVCVSGKDVACPWQSGAKGWEIL